MNAVNPNPYAPPATESFLESPTLSMETLIESGPISFSGSAEDQDLRDYLYADGHVGSVFLFLLWLVIGFVTLVLFMQGGGLVAIAIGSIGFVLVASIVSTIPYRRLVFENANPDWREYRRGELRVDGVHLQRTDTETFFRWDWYWSAVAGDDWVAFLPATQPMQPLLVTRSMLTKLDDWQRLLAVAGAIANHSEQLAEHQHRQQNLRILRDEGRARSLEVPADAIAFQGASRVNDFSRLPSHHRRREKPTRSYVVVGVLFMCGAFIIAGVSNLVFQRFAFLPTLIATYVALAATGIAVRKRRRSNSGRSVVLFSNAYATESSIVTDFAITTNEINWSALQLAEQTDDLIAFRRRHRAQFILARRDMFADDASWRQFGELVNRAELQTQV